MNEIFPNSAEGVPAVDGFDNPAAGAPTTGTEPKENATTGKPQEIETIDYREKFIESAKGAHALLQEKKRLEARVAELENNPAAGTPTYLPNPPLDTDVLYPGFENLDPDAQANLLAYTEAVTRKAKQEIYSDPAIAFAQKTYNETKWNNAFAEVLGEFPELQPEKENFKAQFFNPKNVPDNIGEILKTMAKSYLFDKARDIGAKQAAEVAERVQLEEPTGGDRSPSIHRSLADWQRMAQQNPAKFAALKKEYEADLASGKLQE